MEKNLRVSHDYVAVDVIENSRIKSTPIYLPINKPRELMWLDRDEKKVV